MDTNIILSIFVKNSHTQNLKIGEKWPQLKVPMQTFWKLPLFFSFSIGEEF